MNKTFSAMWSDKLGKAIDKVAPVNYPIECHLGSAELSAITTAVDQGIDSYLEAIDFTQDMGEHGRIKLIFSAHGLRVLVRRLLESGNDESMSLASSICSTLDIELI